ncbi:MAG: aminopeptidase [Deltaproteobacteria bacterium]|nr:aminopeptidase [Deltaproteobacteria bacterium]
MEITGTQLERYADVLLWGLGTARTEKFTKGDIIMVRYDAPAVPLAEILQRKILERGMHPVMRGTPTCAMERNFFEKANSRQLVFQPPGEKTLLENLNGSIYLHAPESLTHLRHIDPKKIGTALVARKALRKILEKREEQGRFGWTLCTFPTPELARQARMTLSSYARQIIRACYLDRKNPVAEWKAIHWKASEIKDRLNSLDVKELHVRSASMDLRITPGRKRKWIGISGHNIPSFELFMSPDWRGTEGVYRANQPSFRSGNYVEDVLLTFRGGTVTAVQARTGREFIQKQLAIDAGANKIGEFSLTDRRFSRINRFMADTLFDENYGGRQGNCHIALGSSYSDTYDGDPARLTEKRKKDLGFNDSALHWDLVNTERKTVTALLRSGESLVIYKDGMFQV